MAERRLVVIHRSVPAGRAGEYDEVWSRARNAAARLGVHAWRYQSIAAPTRFVEFIESRGGGDPRTDHEMARALADLERIASGTAEEYQDVSITIDGAT